MRREEQGLHTRLHTLRLMGGLINVNVHTDKVKRLSPRRKEAF